MTPLHQLGDWLRAMLAVLPLPLVRLLFVAVPLLVLIWMLALPRSSADAGPSEMRNLKTWAAVALIIQILIYAVV